MNGHNGLPGRDGRDGAKGEKGVAGTPGVKGEAGLKGTDTDKKNWKQCVWKKDDGRDSGLVKVSVNPHKKIRSMHDTVKHHTCVCEVSHYISFPFLSLFLLGG